MNTAAGATPFTFEVTDIKQWVHCPRIVYYRYVLPRVRPVTGLMREGQAHHQEESAYEERRSLRPYGISAGERYFDVQLYSAMLGLRGRADMVIAAPRKDAPDAGLVVVEYKLSERKALRNWKLQLAAYALLLEEQWRLPVRRGYIYYIGRRCSEEVPITAALRTGVRTTIEAMRATIAGEQVPPPPRNQGICISCEFRRFCNDTV
ncbi:MAG TPA: CRISPR-associated protein Cas4 [Chloroflexota bacterium]|jgi:CRISPR-associated exonuclease Cas4|nr:CRISPR-associated protein Cas4 [Chloroflexota bacterium]